MNLSEFAVNCAWPGELLTLETEEQGPLVMKRVKDGWKSGENLCRLHTDTLRIGQKVVVEMNGDSRVLTPTGIRLG